MQYHDGRNRTRETGASDPSRRGTGRKLAAISLVVATAAVLATLAAAASPAAKQRVEIINGKDGASFVLHPLKSGAVKRDTGTFAACCWTNRSVTRDGQSVDIDDPQITLTGEHGTLVLRNRIEFVDIPGGDAVFTGTWKVISGTGSYAGLTGGGRVAGVMLLSGRAKSQFQGFLSPK
jgi:hypothetical protein